MRQYDIAMHPKAQEITEEGTLCAPGTGAFDLGGDIVTVFELPRNDRCETFLVYNDGKVILVSCDPNPDGPVDKEWQICYYSCTSMPVADKLRALEHGHWL